MPVRRTPDVMPIRRTPDVMPVRRTTDVMLVRRTLDVMSARRTPDAMPVQGAAETNTDDVTPVQRANWYANHNQFHATLESNGLCSYHNKFGNRAKKCITGCRWFSKNFTSGCFYGKQPPIRYSHILLKLTVQHTLRKPDFSLKTSYQITTSWLIHVPSVLSFLFLVTSTPSTTLPHLTSLQPTVHPSARMVTTSQHTSLRSSLHLDLHHSRCTSSIAWSRLPSALQPDGRRGTPSTPQHRLIYINTSVHLQHRREH